MLKGETDEYSAEQDDISPITEEELPADIEIVDEIPEDTETSEDMLSETDGIEEDIPEDTETDEEIVSETDSVDDDIPEDTEPPESSDYTDEEIQENIKRTPINNGEWTGERGESKWIPENEYVQEMLHRYGEDGIEYKNGLPDFSKVAVIEIDLSESEYTEKNSKQFQSCNYYLAGCFSELAEKYAGADCEDPLSNAEYRDAMKQIFMCDDEELADIQDSLDLGEKPYGYTWHHTETPGRMQLVQTAIHDAARHRGGQTIWGGGNQNR